MHNLKRVHNLQVRNAKATGAGRAWRSSSPPGGEKPFVRVVPRRAMGREGRDRRGGCRRRSAVALQQREERPERNI